MAARIATRVNGHAIVAVYAFGRWVAQIDPETPVMEREFEFRSEYVSADPVGPLSAAMADVLGWSEIV